MKIIFMGTPSFSVPILEALNEKYEILLVVSQPNQRGKKNKVLEPPVATKAKELGLNLTQPDKISTLYETFKELNADVLVTAAYGQFVPSKMLKLFKKCLNVHGSLLPKHRGGAPIQRAIMEGDKTTGITIMEMVKQMDAGRMYAKAEIPILDTDNNETMFTKLSIVGRDLLLNSIEDIVNGKIMGIEQNEAEATISPNIADFEEKIDFNQPARTVFNHIRGLAMNPGAYALINDARLKVYSSKEVLDDSDALPGTVLLAKKRLLVKCQDNAIEILEVKPEGKQIMPSPSFLNGQRLFEVGDTFK